jgi:uncharacterized Zn ribbon protein
MKSIKNLKIGQKVRAIKIEDPYTEIEAGSEGTITFIDDFGTIHVKWDSGRTLGIIPEVDKYEVIML